eukprot:1182445-Prorocentrum_minimum.AAC.1
MLQLVEQYRAHFKDIIAVKLATFFHAMIYDPARRQSDKHDVAEAFFSWNTSVGQPLQLLRAEMVCHIRMSLC